MKLQLDYNPNDPLPDIRRVPEFQKQGIERYLNVEALSMAAPDYFDNRSAAVWRERAVIVIFNVSRQENFDPFVPYLAMNYFDRFISREKAIPKVMKYPQHDLELLSLCCLTLACKMRIKDFSTSRFMAQNEQLRPVVPWEFLTMELHIVKGLDWHLRSVTPLCFVPYLMPYFESAYGFRRRTINEIIIQSQNDFSMTRFRPSVIAASALLAASSFLYPKQFGGYIEKVTSLPIFNEENVLECMEKLIAICENLEILIESAVPENEYLPIRKVRAGDTSEQAAEIAKSAAADRAIFEKLKQKAPTSSEQAAAESSELAATATEEHNKKDIKRPEEAITESSEGPTVASTEKVAAPKPEDSTEESQQVATEKLEEVSIESSKQPTIVQTEQVGTQKSEESTEMPKPASERLEELSTKFSEQLTVAETEQVDAQTSEKTIQEPKQVATERLEKSVTELSEQRPAVLTEQEAVRKSEASFEKSEKSEESTEESKEATGESFEQTGAVSTELPADEESKESTGDSKYAASKKLKEVASEPLEQLTIEFPEQVAAGKTEESTEDSKEETGESSEQLKAVSTEQEADEKSEESTDDSKHEANKKLKEVAAEPLEQPTLEDPKQVAAGRTEESTAQESTQAASERSKEVATESAVRSTIERASSSASTNSQRQSKGKEKLVEEITETTEMPQMAEDSDDMALAFVLRWRLGEMNAEGFVIFTDMAGFDGPVQVLVEPAGVNQGPQNNLPNICNLCCRCCNCSNCCNSCSLL